MTENFYPRWIMWSMFATLAAAFLILVIGSPSHKDTDPLFWFITGSACGLIFLSVILHHGKSEEERSRFIRVFFLGEWLFGLVMAVYVMWTRR